MIELKVNISKSLYDRIKKIADGYIKIDRFFPSSKTCSNCGYVQDMPLSKRVFNCPNCGISIDRDLNASLNIRNVGINTVGHTL